MNVRELSMEQLRELKENFFYREEENGEIENMNKYEYSHDIPDSVIFEEYGATSFSNDDFGCSSGKSEDEYDIRGDLMERFDEIMDIIGDIESDFRRGRISFDEALADIEDEINMHKKASVQNQSIGELRRFLVVYVDDCGENGKFFYYEEEEDMLELSGFDGYCSYPVFVDSNDIIVRDNFNSLYEGKNLYEAYYGIVWKSVDK